MFAFCVMKLGFSEDATYNRLGVAHAGRKFPAVLDALRSGEVHLSGLRVLVPRLTAENHRQLLARAAGKSKREIEELVAALAPKPPVPDAMRKLPRSVPSETAQLALAPAAARRVEHARSIAPLSEDTFKVQFTASRRLRDKLRQAQDLLRHRLPSGDLANIVESAVDLLIVKVKKERFAAGRKPRPNGKANTAGPCPRPMPASVRRHVYVRDQGRCTFVDEFGNRCPETGMLEFDHIDGWARTHTHDPDRIRLGCPCAQSARRRAVVRPRLHGTGAPASGNSSRPGAGRDASPPAVHGTRADESAGGGPV